MIFRILSFFLLTSLALFAQAELKPMTIKDMGDVTGQYGLTIDAKLKTNVFDTSIQNAAKDGEDKFFVFDNVRLDLEFKGLTLDFDGNYNGSGNPSLILGLPDRIAFNNTSLGIVSQSFTEDGSSPGTSSQAPARYLVKAGNKNLQCGGAFCATNAFPTTYQFTHNGAGNNFTLSSATNGTISNVTKRWDNVGVKYTKGQYDTVLLTVNNLQPNAQLRLRGVINHGTTVGSYGDIEPFITLLNLDTFEELNDDDANGNSGQCTRFIGGCTSIEASEFLTRPLGNPVAVDVNRQLGSLNIDGGISMRGRVIINN